MNLSSQPIRASRMPTLGVTLRRYPQMYSEDAQLLAPEAPIIKGREAIAEVWKALLGTGGNHVRVEILEVQESGDWAYEIGRFVALRPTGGV